MDTFSDGSLWNPGDDFYCDTFPGKVSVLVPAYKKKPVFPKESRTRAPIKNTPLGVKG